MPIVGEEKAEVAKRRSLALRSLVSEVEETGLDTHASHNGPLPSPKGRHNLRNLEGGLCASWAYLCVSCDGTRISLAQLLMLKAAISLSRLLSPGRIQVVIYCLDKAS